MMHQLNIKGYLLRPNVGGGRRPTVAEMTYDKSLDGFHWEGIFSDQALEKPLKAKMDFKKNERDLQNYGIDLHTEVHCSIFFLRDLLFERIMGWNGYFC